MADELNLSMTEEQKQLIFRAELGDEQHNGECKLCSPQVLKMGLDKKHTLSLHFTKQWELSDGRTINGCRLDTVSCACPEAERNRYHYHCPKCIDYNCRRQSRMEKHYKKCDNESKSSLNLDVKKKFKKPSNRAKYSECPYCDIIGLATNMNRHIKDIHGMRPSLPATTVDLKRGLFMVRCAKSGYAKPVHVKFLTFNQENSAVHCSQAVCNDFAKAAHRIGRTAVLCIHLESCKLAAPTKFEPLKRSAFEKIGLSAVLKNRLEHAINEAFEDDKTPPIVLMNLNCELKDANYLYFSCYNPSEKGDSYCKRVLTTLDVSSCHFSCDCNLLNCVHMYLAQIYTHQLDSSLVLAAPKLPLSPDVENNVNDSKEFKDHVQLLQNVTNYLYQEKKNNFEVPHPGLLSEDFSSLKTLVPKETLCYHCKVNLSEPRLVNSNGKIIRKELPPLGGVEVFQKVCPKCSMFYRYQEYTDGVHNFNDHVLASVKLLEHLLLERNKEVPVQKCLEGLNIEFGVPRFIYKSVTDALGHYMSLKRIPFGMNCYQCGPRPNVLIMDTTCKVAFSLTTAQKQEMYKDTTTPYKSYKEFYIDVCKYDIMLGLTESAEVLDLFRLKLSKNWLPFIGENMVLESQPCSTRCISNIEQRPKNPFPISYDRLRSIADDKKTGTSQLNKLCTKLGLPYKNLANSKKMSNIVNADLCYDNFKKEFFAISGKSGGVLRGMCTHGITCAMKVLIDPEGATDYAHCVFSFKDENLASVLCIDFAPQVGEHIQRVRPNFNFKHHCGALLPYTLESLERLEKKGAVSEPTLNMQAWRFGEDTSNDPRFCIIDDFHSCNHKSIYAKLHKRESCVQLDKTFNSSVLEQQNKLLRKHACYMNMQKPHRHIKSMVYFMTRENMRINSKLCKEVSSAGTRVGFDEFVIGPDKPYFISKGKKKLNDIDEEEVTQADSIFSCYEARTHENATSPTESTTPKHKTPSMSIMEAQPNVLLPNVAQNCWLNVTINMLTAVGASDRIYTFLMLCNLRTAAYLFFQMLKSQNIDRNIVSQFAADCIYKMRVQKVSLTEVELYRKGTCQDAFEALLTIFFPMMEEAGIHFKLSTDTPLMTLSSPQDNIRNSILAIIPGGVTNLPPDFFFIQVNRGSGTNNGFSFTIPHEILDIGSNRENFVLSTFITHTGSRSTGHYTIYIKEPSQFILVSDTVRKPVSKQEFDDAASHFSVTICYKKCEAISDSIPLAPFAAALEIHSECIDTDAEALNDVNAELDVIEAEQVAVQARIDAITALKNIAGNSTAALEIPSEAATEPTPHVAPEAASQGDPEATSQVAPEENSEAAPEDTFQAAQEVPSNSVAAPVDTSVAAPKDIHVAAPEATSTFKPTPHVAPEAASQGDPEATSQVAPEENSEAAPEDTFQAAQEVPSNSVAAPVDTSVAAPKDIHVAAPEATSTFKPPNLRSPYTFRSHARSSSPPISKFQTAISRSNFQNKPAKTACSRHFNQSKRPRRTRKLLSKYNVPSYISSSSSDSSPEHPPKSRRPSSPDRYISSGEEALLEIEDHIWLTADVRSRRLDLRNNDKDSLGPRKMITGSVMDSFMNIIKDQFNNFHCQSALLQEKFNPIPPEEKFIQIINLNLNHWIVLSDCLVEESDTIFVYDSLHGFKRSSRYIPPHIIAKYSKYAKALRPKTKNLQFVNVQQQSADSNDCGAFALFFAVFLAQGEFPLTKMIPMTFRGKVASTLENLRYDFGQLDFQNEEEKSLMILYKVKVK